MTQIKICGLTREADIDYVNEAKPDYIGFVLNFPKSRRNLTPERAAAKRQTPARAVAALTRPSLPTPAPEAAAQTPTTQQTQRTNFHF